MLHQVILDVIYGLGADFSRFLQAFPLCNCIKARQNAINQDVIRVVKIAYKEGMLCVNSNTDYSVIGTVVR